MEEKSLPAENPAKKPPLRSAFLGLVALQSSANIAQADIPQAMAGNVDVFGTVLDAGILTWCTNELLRQAGVLKPPDTGISLDGFAARVTLSLGREPGTWMPPEWAASGARLSLPLTVRFTDEPVDLGFPGEENFGGRYAKRLVVEPGSFVGPQGEVVVKPTAGAYILQPGQTAQVSNSSSVMTISLIRFFIDFPEEYSRNDVSIPAGRVFFSSSLLTGIPKGGMVEVLGGMPGDESASDIPDLVDGPGDVKLLREGGLSITKNTWRNLWGILGDVNLILGRFTFSAAEQTTRDPFR